MDADFDFDSYVRQTSVDVYRSMRDEGLLTESRLKIYGFLFEHGPCTANELFQKTKGFNTITQANFHARLGELRDCGVVDELGTKKCTVTGNTVIVWDCNNKLPVKINKRETNADRVRRLNKLLNWICKEHPHLKPSILQKAQELKV